MQRQMGKRKIIIFRENNKFKLSIKNLRKIQKDNLKLSFNYERNNKIKFIKIFIKNENGMPRIARIYANHKEDLIIKISISRKFNI